MADYTYPNPGTFTFPWPGAHVASILVETYAAGGGGGGPNLTNDHLTGGGAGGGYSSAVISNGSGNYSIVVGLGGVGGAAATNGGTGGDSSFAALVVAKGGPGGLTTNSGATGGQGTIIGAVGAVTNRGGHGGDATGADTGAGGGGGGGDAVGGTPGTGVGLGGSGGLGTATRNGLGSPGNSYGGGGGGGKGRTGLGAVGADGYVQITITGTRGSFSSPLIAVTPVIAAPESRSGPSDPVSFYVDSLGLITPRLSIRPTLLVGALKASSTGLFTAPQLSTQLSMSVGELSATQTGFLALQLNVVPAIQVGTLTAIQSASRKFAELKVFLDSLHLEEIKVVELFSAGQDIYSLEKLSSREVEKVLVSGEPVSFTRFKDAIRLTEAAAGPVTVIPAKRINSFQLGEAEPIEIFIGTNPVVGYSSFSITSVNTLDNTQGAWKFSLTYDGVPEFTLLSDSVPESLWVFPDVALSTMSYATAVELTAFASLRKK